MSHELVQRLTTVPTEANMASCSQATESEFYQASNSITPRINTFTNLIDKQDGFSQKEPVMPLVKKNTGRRALNAHIRIPKGMDSNVQISDEQLQILESTGNILARQQNQSNSYSDHLRARLKSRGKNRSKNKMQQA